MIVLLMLQLRCGRQWGGWFTGVWSALACTLVGLGTGSAGMRIDWHRSQAARVLACCSATTYRMP